MIKSTFLVAIVAAGMALSATGEANAWTRQGTFTGPNGGTVTTWGSGSCTKGGGCTWQGGGTGPNGNSWKRNGSIHR